MSSDSLLALAGLYFHVPFRRARRSYDDAYYVVSQASSFEAYVHAVCRELRFYAEQYAEDEPVETISAGGGRPSLLPLSDVRPILHTVLDVFDASVFQEATAEVSPADATLHYLGGLRSLGFDRLHFEVLSFFPEDLDALGAPHSADDAVRALREARTAGFDAVSIDLSFGWPSQPMLHWKANLQQAVRMNVPHVTIVEWTPPSSSGNRDDEPQSHAKADRDQEIDLARRLQFAMDFLLDEGYEQYELTHFARPGYRSRHQDGYYRHENYLGVGPSASTFWWPHRTRNGPAKRWSNVKDVDRYIDLLENQYSPVAYRQTVDWTTLAREYVVLRLRTSEGLDLRRLQAMYDVDLRTKREQLLNRLVENDLIEPYDDGVIRLTVRGRLVADGVTHRLMPD